MATYELYLWEPEVDLSNQTWNNLLGHSNEEDSDAMILAIQQEIYSLHRDQKQPAPHIEMFFNCIIERLNKPEYEKYFEGMSDWIMEQQGFFNKRPRLVFRDEATLANATSNEFKRALYEAIEQSGVCALNTMDGYLIPSDARAREYTFNLIFSDYPALLAQPLRPPVTLESTPQNVTDMRDIVCAFMQQHPVGCQFEVKKIDKEFNDRTQYYCIRFIKELEDLTQYFLVSFHYDKKKEFFNLDIPCNDFSFAKQFLSKEEEVLLNSNKLFINAYHINLSSFRIPLWSKYLASLKHYPERKKLESFILEKNEMALFSLFLEQLNISLNTYAHIINMQGLADLIFQPKGIIHKDLEFVAKGGVSDFISGGLIASLYKLSLYTQIDEKYKKNLDSVFANYNKNYKNVQEYFKDFEKTKEVIMEYVKNKRLD